VGESCVSLPSFVEGTDPASSAPYVALNFASYELFKIHMTDEDGHQPGTLMKLGCGALAGSISQTVRPTSPLSPTLS
jgi:hypothetical protein